MQTLATSPKIIALDMDGTLLGADGRVSARNLAALRAAEEREVEVVIATGRRHCYAMRVLRELGLRESHALISSNGAVVRTIGSTLMERTMLPLDVAARLCRHMDGFRNTLVLTFDLVGPDGEDENGALVVEELDDLHASVGAWMRANAPYIRNVTRLEEVLEGGDGALIQAMLCGPVERMREAEGRLLRLDGVQASPLPGEVERVHGAQIAVHRTEYPEKDLCIVDILPAGCSKGAALRRLAGLRGVEMDAVMAIGDNWNDVSMLDVAGQGVLMANAPAELHEMAARHGWMVGAAHYEDGVAMALEQVFAGEAAGAVAGAR